MYKTDEEVLDAFLDGGSEPEAARILGTTRQAVNIRLRTMKLAGVNIPRLNAVGARGKFPPERVKQLNEHIQKKGNA